MSSSTSERSASRAGATKASANRSNRVLLVLWSSSSYEESAQQAHIARRRPVEASLLPGVRRICYFHLFLNRCSVVVSSGHTGFLPGHAEQGVLFYWTVSRSRARWKKVFQSDRESDKSAFRWTTHHKVIHLIANPSPWLVQGLVRFAGLVTPAGWVVRATKVVWWHGSVRSLPDKKSIPKKRVDQDLLTRLLGSGTVMSAGLKPPVDSPGRNEDLQNFTPMRRKKVFAIPRKKRARTYVSM